MRQCARQRSWRFRSKGSVDAMDTLWPELLTKTPWSPTRATVDTDSKLRETRPALTVGSLDDPLEKEADVIADRALTGTAPALGGSPVDVHRSDASPSGAGAAAPESVERVLSTSGDRLDAAVPRDMEQGFGHDFSLVRVHSGAAAERSARDIGAEAYTVGNNVVIGEGRRAQGLDHRRTVLAHELVHVVHQRGAQPMVQRKPADTPAPAAKSKIDVSIVLSDGDQDLSEGAAYAKTVLRVTDVGDAAAKLKALGAPIGKL